MTKPSSWKKAAAIFVFCAATRIASLGQTFTTLFSFDGTNGSLPVATLVQLTDGNFYGTTLQGGANDGGTVFRITPKGKLTTLYSFCSVIEYGLCTDGSGPGGLVQATNGDLYGTTDAGGAYGFPIGYGTVFKITPSGTLTTLYNFGGGAADGNAPNGPLIRATDGNFYGTTMSGGANGHYDSGTVFKITRSGKLTTLYSFCSVIENGLCMDGAFPFAGLVQATNGDLYGTTQGGGAKDEGTVFRITRNHKLTTLFSFCSQSCTDGENPIVGLVQTANGDLFGTTLWGGTSGDGTVFKITPSGKLTTLYSFCSVVEDGVCTDGADPKGLVQAAHGDLYGTSRFGGANLYSGTVFKITAGGELTTLYSFCSKSGCMDGEDPQAALVQGTNGMFYGATSKGGAYGYGTIFSLSVGLGPFVRTLPAAGEVDAEVGILGTKLTGATGITFNGTTAQFRVVSPTLILTHVPTGATTGTINVNLPGQTLSSNVPFYVLK